MRWWWTRFWEQMNLQDFTSVWDLLEILFAEILPFVSQLTDRFSQTIKTDERTEEILFTSVDSGGAERDWKLYRKQKSKLISPTLNPITCTNIRCVRLLLTWLIFSNSPQSSTFTASATFFTYSIRIRIWIRISFIGQVCLHTVYWGICYSDRSSTVQQNDSNRTGHR